jgi:hypothetical protein
MKKIITLVFVSAVVLNACGDKKDESQDHEILPVEDTLANGPQFYGDEITEEGALAVNAVVDTLSSVDSVQIKLTGTIDAVCKVKGCWMTMNISDGKTMRVKFKGYKFFVPKDAGGKTAIVDGWAYKEIVSVEDLKHLAEDNGDSKEEIAKITEPAMEYSFMAHGVIIK